ARRHQDARTSGLAAPPHARRRGGIRRLHPRFRHRPRPGDRRRAAGPGQRVMATDATAAPGAADREAGWRDVVAVLGSRVLDRLRLVAAVIRPLGWTVMTLALTAFITGQLLGWHEVVVVGLALAMIAVICALFLVGRTEYEVSLDLARNRVVVGERAVGALTLHNSSTRAILPSRVVLPVGGGRGEFSIQRQLGGAPR